MTARRLAGRRAAAVALATVCLVPVGAPAATGGSSPGAVVAEVRIPFPKDDGTLTPYTFDLGYQLMTLVYDTLLWRDADGVPRPWLAQSADTSADGLTVTVHLAAGARWQDGRPVTSADVAFTFGYVARHRHPRFTPEVGDVAGVDTPDPMTAVIRLDHPSLGFADLPLADLPILPQHIWGTLPDTAQVPAGLPVGSGPYRLVAYGPTKGYTFQADPAYFRGPPRVATITVPIIRDEAGTAQALRRRNVDMLPVTLSPNLDASVQGLGIREATGTSYLGTVLMLNTRQAPFDRPAVRQAVAEALDLPRIADDVGGSRVPADHGYIHPASPWASTQVLHRLDTSAATAGLAPLAAAPVDVLAADNDPVKIEAGRQVALALERAGVAANLRTLPVGDLDRAVGADGSTPTFALAIWSAPALASYDPDELSQLFASGSPFDYTGYSSATFDDLMRQVASAPDAATRLRAVQRALRTLAGDAPVVPLFFERGSFAYRPAVYDGWVYVKGEGILDKRSFVGPARPSSTASDAPPAAAVPAPDSGPSALGIAALVLLGVAAVAGAAQLLRGRRGR